MALKVITGPKGSGKTAWCCKLMHDGYRKGYPVYSNFHVNFPFEKINFTWMMSNQNALKSAVVALDEAHTEFDCRCSAQKKNKVFSYLMLQGRKRKVDFLLTSQQETQLDIRIRRNAEIVYECKAMTLSNNKLRPSTIKEIEGHQVARILIEEFDYVQNAVRKILFDPRPYFDLYDSDEFVEVEI